MYIDKHYPFEMIPLKYPLTSFSDFLDFQTLSIHYNQIYKGYIDELNKNLQDLKNLQTLSLDEILFNENLIPTTKRTKTIYAASGAYNHQIIFESMTPNPIVQISPKLKMAIEKKYQSLNNFYQEFKKACLNLNGCGFVFLVCDKDGKVAIEQVLGNKTTVKANLCPIFGIDMFEHAYYLKYKNDKKTYVEQWLKYICFEYANNEYEECLKAIELNKKQEPKF